MRQEPSPPSTFDFLAYRAGIEPGKIALATPLRKISYLRFYQDVLRFSLALKALGVSQGSLVVVLVNSDIYLHWLLLIACENNGAVSVSWPNVKTLPSICFREAVDFTFSEYFIESELEIGCCFRLDADWLNKVFRMDLSAERDFRPNMIALDDVQRITHSSGTTGGQKAMLLKRRAQEQKIRFFAENLYLCRDDSLLLTMSFSVNAAFLCATHFLRLGLLVVSGPIIWALQNFPVTYFEILPLALNSLLQKIPDDFIRPEKLHVRVIGASFGSELKKKSLQAICTEISGRYATNEVWPIAYGMNHEQLGTLLPGVQVKIIDDLGVEMAAGSIGQIAVKTSTMVDGYYKNEKATARHFVDGYFLTGDIGRLLPSRGLQLLGRCDDVLNLGGMKSSPDSIEARIKSIDGVLDAAATSIISGQAIEELCVAVVIENVAERCTGIKQTVVDSVSSLGLQRVLLKFVGSLPQTENGKLSRQMLQQIFLKD